jgi:hypothetical protein
MLKPAAGADQISRAAAPARVRRSRRSAYVTLAAAQECREDRKREGGARDDSPIAWVEKARSRRV